MTKENMADVAVEVICILDRFPDSFKKKIPQDFVDLIKSLKSNTYTFMYDESKSLNEQNIKPETKGMIAYIYENFCCTEEEKEQYKRKCREFENRQEEEARIKYNADNIFQTKRLNKMSNIATENKVLEESNIYECLKEGSLGMVENKKEKWWN